MTTALELAIPLNANFVATTMRAKLAEAGIYFTTDPDLSAEDFSIQPWSAVAVYGADGDLELYAYDASDTTTADDGGVSCIVVSGRRYKKRVDVIVRDSVLSATTAAQPGSPSLGDAYVLTAAPTGTDWSGNAKKVAQYTARGWIFRAPFVGMIVYSEDDASFWHYGAAGSWTQGLAAGGFADASIAPKKLFHPFAILKVVDQRNAPPGGTPTEGTMYQVGTSPTGAFASHSNDIARWNAAGAWEFITPAEGDSIYRLDVKLPYTYRSGVWVPTIAASGVQQIKRRVMSAVAFNNVTGTIQRDTGVDFQSTTGKYLRFTVFSASMSFTDGSPNSTDHQLRIYVDTGTSALATVLTISSASTTGSSASTGVLQFIYAVPDSASHNYQIGILRTSGPDGSRDFSITADMLVEELVIL